MKKTILGVIALLTALSSVSVANADKTNLSPQLKGEVDKELISGQGEFSEFGMQFVDGADAALIKDNAAKKAE